MSYAIPILASGRAQESVLETPIRYQSTVIVPGNSNDRVLIKAFGTSEAVTLRGVELKFVCSQMSTSEAVGTRFE